VPPAVSEAWAVVARGSDPAAVSGAAVVAMHGRVSAPSGGVGVDPAARGTGGGVRDVAGAIVSARSPPGYPAPGEGG
jgi:hypothetical protein